VTVVGDAGDRGQMLLALAREALSDAFGAEPVPVAEQPWLESPGASFVTLKINGDLQGCIGTLEAYRPLAEDVRGNALAAAFRDPRFPSLEADQLPQLRIEVSVLSDLEPLPWIDEADLLRRLRPGIDGLVLAHEGHRGTFLPAVWHQLPRPEEFLRQLKRKAGLTPEFWAADVSISRYTVDSWAEPAA
jgi:AmmeMemoRadiSam system protein A